MKKNNRSTYAVSLAVLMQSSAFAFPTAFISVDAATLFAEPGHTQAVALLNTLGNTYVLNDQWQHDESIILGMGITTYQHHDIEINTSARYIAQVIMPIQGDVLQLHAERFRNLTYRYDVASSFWLSDNTITWTKHRLQPGIILGVGAALNKASNYHEKALNKHSAPSFSPFANRHTTQLAYEIGAVLDYSIQAVVFECAYRYLNAGEALLGLSSLQNTENHLSTGPLHYNVISLGVRIHYDF
jgi:hypothetical protein